VMSSDFPTRRSSFALFFILFFFRFPNNKELFCAVLGNGSQLLGVCGGVLVLACLGVYSQYNRGALFVAALLIFALTSGINGYVAGV